MAFLAGGSGPVLAQSTWTLAEAEGAVFLQRGGERLPVGRGDTIETGDKIATGARGRAVLVQNGDLLTLAANSRVQVSPAAGGAIPTRILQDLGNVVFRIDGRSARHIAVETPFLAALGMGTTFSLTVGAAGTSLQVIKGTVEVATRDGSARDLIRPGSIVLVAQDDQHRLSVSGDQPRVVDSANRRTAVMDSGLATGVSAAGAPGLSLVPVPLASYVTRQQELHHGPAGRAIDVALEAQAGDEISAPVIEVAVSNRPADLAQATGGLVEATSPVGIAVGEVVRDRRRSDGNDEELKGYSSGLGGAGDRHELDLIADLAAEGRN